MEEDKQKSVLTLVAALAVAQTFFVGIAGSVLMTDSPRWVALGCLAIFSLVNLAVSLVIGTVLTRAVERIQSLSAYVDKIDARTRGSTSASRKSNLS